MARNEKFALHLALSPPSFYKTRVQTELFISYIKTEMKVPQALGFCCTHCNLIGSYSIPLSIVHYDSRYLLTIGRINTQRRDTKNRIHRTSFHVLQERLSLQALSGSLYIKFPQTSFALVHYKLAGSQKFSLSNSYCEPN